mgnify:CR=1 FL=1
MARETAVFLESAAAAAFHTTTNATTIASSYLQDAFRQIPVGAFNRATGFYPFVVHRETGIIVAHGEAGGVLVDRTISEAFEIMNITHEFVNGEAVHQRF